MSILSKLNPDQNWGQLVKEDEQPEAYKSAIPVVFGRHWVTGVLVWTGQTMVSVHNGSSVTLRTYTGQGWDVYPNKFQAWTSSTGYTAGTSYVTDGGFLYQCTQTGTSGTTPPSQSSTPYGTAIADGTVVWKWLQEGTSWFQCAQTKGLTALLAPAIYAIAEGPIIQVFGAKKDGIFYCAQGQTDNTWKVIRLSNGRADPPLACIQGTTGYVVGGFNIPLGGRCPDGNLHPWFAFGSDGASPAVQPGSQSGFQVGGPSQNWSFGWTFGGSVASGAYVPGQQVNFTPAQELGYSGTAILNSMGIEIASGATDYPSIEFLVDGIGTQMSVTQTDGTVVYGVNPADVIVAIWTNTRWGMGRSSAELDVEHGADGNTASSCRAYCAALGMAVARSIETQESAQDALKSLLDEINCMPVWTTTSSGAGLLRIVPRGTKAQNGYTPPSASVYTLGIDDFAGNPGSDRMEVERTPMKDVRNYYPVVYESAEGYSGKTQATATNTYWSDYDQANGAPIVKAQNYSARWVANATHAMALSYILADRSRNVRQRYRFKLSPRYVRLEGGDLITLNHARMGLSGQAAMVLSTEEDSKGFISVVAEQWTGTVTPAAQIQSRDGLTGQGIGPTVQQTQVVDLSYISAQLAQLASDSSITPSEKRTVTSDLMQLFSSVGTNVVEATLLLPPAWTAAMTVSKTGLVVANAGNYYQSTTTGTAGSTAPTWTSGTQSDGGVSWSYVGPASSGQVQSALTTYEAAIAALAAYCLASVPTRGTAATAGSGGNGLGVTGSLAYTASPFSFTPPALSDYNTWVSTSDATASDGTITIDGPTFRSAFLNAFAANNALLLLVSGVQLALQGGGTIVTSGTGTAVVFGTGKPSSSPAEPEFYIQTDEPYSTWYWDGSAWHLVVLEGGTPGTSTITSTTDITTIIEEIEETLLKLLGGTSTTTTTETIQQVLTELNSETAALLTALETELQSSLVNLGTDVTLSPLNIQETVTQTDTGTTVTTVIAEAQQIVTGSSGNTTTTTATEEVIAIVTEMTGGTAVTVATEAATSTTTSSVGGTSTTTTTETSELMVAEVSSGTDIVVVAEEAQSVVTGAAGHTSITTSTEVVESNTSSSSGNTDVVTVVEESVSVTTNASGQTEVTVTTEVVEAIATNSSGGTDVQTNPAFPPGTTSIVESTTTVDVNPIGPIYQGQGGVITSDYVPASYPVPFVAANAGGYALQIGPLNAGPPPGAVPSVGDFIYQGTASAPTATLTITSVSVGAGIYFLNSGATSTGFVAGNVNWVPMGANEIPITGAKLRASPPGGGCSALFGLSGIQIGSTKLSAAWFATNFLVQDIMTVGGGNASWVYGGRYGAVSISSNTLNVPLNTSALPLNFVANGAAPVVSLTPVGAPVASGAIFSVTLPTRGQTSFGIVLYQGTTQLNPASYTFYLMVTSFWNLSSGYAL